MIQAKDVEDLLQASIEAMQALMDTKYFGSSTWKKLKNNIEKMNAILEKEK